MQGSAWRRLNKFTWLNQQFNLDRQARAWGVGCVDCFIVCASSNVTDTSKALLRRGLDVCKKRLSWHFGWLSVACRAPQNIVLVNTGCGCGCIVSYAAGDIALQCAEEEIRVVQLKKLVRCGMNWKMRSRSGAPSVGDQYDSLLR